MHEHGHTNLHDAYLTVVATEIQNIQIATETCALTWPYQLTGSSPQLEAHLAVVATEIQNMQIAMETCAGTWPYRFT